MFKIKRDLTNYPEKDDAAKEKTSKEKTGNSHKKKQKWLINL